jgi:Kdo2-lipid IVA lauroyltransferase/acyltransferase
MLVAMFRLLGRMPLSLLHRAGAALGWLVYWLSPRYAERIRANLYASGVSGDDAQRKALLRGTVGEAGKGMTELLAVWFGSDEKVTGLAVEYEGWKVAQAAHARGKGMIIVTPHLGCFEMVGLFVAQRLPMTSLYRPPRLGWIEPLMLAGRSRWRAVLAPANLRGVRMLYKALARGEVVGLLPDQTPGAGEGVWADFFGRPAYTMTLVRRLHEKSRAPVVMVVAERLPAGRGYSLRFRELVVQSLLDETAINRAIETEIRRCPEQYLWSYYRYKARAGTDEPPAKSEGGSRKAEA